MYKIMWWSYGRNLFSTFECMIRNHLIRRTARHHRKTYENLTRQQRRWQPAIYGALMAMRMITMWSWHSVVISVRPKWNYLFVRCVFNLKFVVYIRIERDSPISTNSFPQIPSSSYTYHHASSLEQNEVFWAKGKNKHLFSVTANKFMYFYSK